MLTCPACNYPQYCGCASCEQFLPEGMFPQVETASDVLACPNCGFAAHIDYWEGRGVEAVASLTAESEGKR